MFDFFIKREAGIRQEILAGIATGFYLFPEIIAVAFLAGVSPNQALLSVSFSCVVASFLTGSEGLVTGSSRAIALICMTLTVRNGLELLFPTIILAGLIQMSLGYFKLAKFIRMVPRSVYMGFLNGFSVLLLIYLAKSIYEIPFHSFIEISLKWEMECILFVFGLIILYVVPKFFKAIPSVLLLFMVGIILSQVEHNGLLSINDYVSSFDLSLKEIHLSLSHMSAFSIIDFVEVVLPYGLLIAFSATVESLMGVMMVDELTNKRGIGNKETIAQGVSNIVAGLVMGLPSIGMIGATAINLKSGGRSKLSSIFAGITLLLVAVFFKKFILELPLVIFIVVNFAIFLGLFSWSGLRFFHRIPLRDTFVLIIVSGLTILTEYPAVVILIGVVISALGFAWDNAVQIRIIRSIKESNIIDYEVRGLLFFASFNHFLDKFEFEKDLGEVTIDFKNARILDHSGIDAIYSLSEQYLKKGCELNLRSLSRDSRFLIQNAMTNSHVTLVEAPDDPIYKVVTDKVIHKYE